MSLLLKAKNHNPKRRKYSFEEINLAIGWLKGEIRVVQAQSVLHKKHKHSTYTFFALAIREAFNLGKLKLPTPLSEESKLEHEADWKPEYMGTLQDTIQIRQKGSE